MMKRAAFVAALLLQGCATPSARPAEPVLHYLRTNSDGSEPERVVVHVVSPTRIEVFKAKSRCTTAAYVTAQLDASGQARHLVGGRLTRALTQERFAWLDEEGGRLIARLGAPDAPPQFEIAAAGRWVLFDFDFADLAASRPREIRSGEPLAFDLPLLFDRGEGFVLENLGRLTLAPAGSEDHAGEPARRYRAHGPALGSGEGTLWFRAADGRLLEARLPIPNHGEYRDFRLRLVGEGDGAAAWRAVLAEHWRDCPVED
jgi:hypothetical protein